MNQARILVVDDDPNITQSLRLILEKTGRFTVRTENVGTNALATARDFRPDLVLLDVMMPDIDGGRVAEQIRGDSGFKNIPIVFLTAIVKKEEVEARDGIIGGFPYIAKPMNAKGVIRVIDENLAR
jgi:two-component system, OmpR family, response regulator